jgi:predicted DNA-binding transcriptional regulator AlpA
LFPAGGLKQEVPTMPTETADSLRLINEQHLAKLTGLKVTAIQHLRRSGKGPIYAKIGSRVLYQIADVQAWLDAKKRTATTAAE